MKDRLGFVLFGIFVLALAIVFPATASWGITAKVFAGMGFGLLGAFSIVIGVCWNQIMKIADDHVTRELKKDTASDDFIGWNPMVKTIDPDDLRD